MSLNRIAVLYRIDDADCTLCQERKKCYQLIDFETHEDYSHVLCSTCWHKKVQCVGCSKELYDSKFASDIYPDGNRWLDDTCEECIAKENEEWEAEQKKEREAKNQKGEEQPEEDYWGNQWGNTNN